MEDLIAENLKEPVKPTLRVLSLLTYQFLAEIVTQQPAACCERERELLGAADAFRRRREEALQQLRNRRDALLFQSKLWVLKIGLIAKPLALRWPVFVDPNEMEIVGQDNVVR